MPASIIPIIPTVHISEIVTSERDPEMGMQVSDQQYMSIECIEYIYNDTIQQEQHLTQSVEATDHCSLLEGIFNNIAIEEEQDFDTHIGDLSLQEPSPALHDTNPELEVVSSLLQQCTHQQGQQGGQEQQQVQEVNYMQPLLPPNRGSSQLLSRPSRLAVPKAASYCTQQVDRDASRSQSHTLNRLEIENAFLLNQNNSLNKDIQHCRQTVQALKHILAQKEKTIECMNEEFRQVCLKTKFMESVLAEQQKFNFEMALNAFQPLESSTGSLHDFSNQEEKRLGVRRVLQDDDSNGSESVGDSESDDVEDENIEDDEFSDDDDARFLSVSNLRFQGMGLDHILQASQTISESFNTATDLTESNNAMIVNLEEISSTSPQQVLRRRPRFHLGYAAAEPTLSTTSLHTSPFMASKSIFFEDPERSSSSSSLSTRADSTIENDQAESNTITFATREKEKAIVLRDSGHFPTEVFSVETKSIFSNAAQQCIIDAEGGSTLPLKPQPFDECLNLPLRPISRLYLGSSPATSPLVILDQNYIEASASSATISTKPTLIASFESAIHPSHADVERGESKPSAPEEANESRSYHDESDGEMDENRSHSSISTIMAPAEDDSEQVNTPEVSKSLTDGALSLSTLLKEETGAVHKYEESQPSAQKEANEGTRPHVSSSRGTRSSPIMFRISSKIRGKGRLRKSKSRDMMTYKGKEKASISTSDMGAKFKASKNNMTLGTSKLAIAMATTTNSPQAAATSSITRSASMTDGSKSTTTLLSRIWGGFGKQTSGLFAGRLSTDRIKTETKSPPVETITTTGIVSEAGEELDFGRSSSPTLCGEVGSRGGVRVINKECRDPAPWLADSIEVTNNITCISYCD
ncbi:hypothetical protein BX616_000337 [Lobosporangium transversale]|uniref:Uncharacterized protein n=1 Tax=Lobosporangium transversale TaxID=64571 RepID=A0A1Y2GIV2_9FUNG|nr:hypothetical protein BCR41DRAFT_142574 [Lobosporangium transversale]KAF9907779.1 hypothetical protein BX616_000337 [Lobosporangium transversale]ORZ08767.1 hypothetical protein BCR41DRAFT_142574 [Lobosporangium transversale]|eukprot:XP_021878550.1 hypothetical protein BCR41DRAFT_142574 [Lobosporangium transversale]